MANGCPACHAPSGRRTDREWRVCPRCRSRWRDAPSTGTAEAAHDQLYFGDEPALEMSSLRSLSQYVEFVDAEVGLAGRRVIDVGCGQSDLADLIGERGASYTGVELSARARAYQRSHGRTVVASFDELPDDAAFDIATLIEVIEHLDNPDSLLAGVCARLEPNGVALITTPNVRGLSARIQGHRWRQARNPTHVALYSPRGLAAVLARAGLRPMARLRYFVDPRWPFSKRIMLRLLQTCSLDGGLRVLVERNGNDRYSV